MKNKLFTGVATALATPFIDEKINFKVFEEFIELQINSGINALVVCGTTGEASTMSQNEKIINQLVILFQFLLFYIMFQVVQE